MSNPTQVPPLANPQVQVLDSLSVARGQNFWLQWLEGPSTVQATSGEEILVLLPEGGAELQTASEVMQLPARSVNIVPAGTLQLTIAPGCRAALIAHSRPDLSNADALNASDYERPDPRVQAVTAQWTRVREPGRVQVIEIDKLTAPLDKPRLKMLRSDFMSINWVEYSGQRDRTALSPHAHADFEQGSLAIEGEFVHHLRTPWGADANAWREDAHLPAPSPSLLTIPVQLVHTTEGTGQGRHLLIDIFSPAREDFIAKGWVLNAGDYARL